MTDIDSSANEMLGDAAQHLRAALDLLDRAGAPGQIGAWVDHAASAIDEILIDVDHMPQLRSPPSDDFEAVHPL